MSISFLSSVTRRTCQVLLASSGVSRRSSQKVLSLFRNARTLSKLNAFDLVVTVALGSCLTTVLLSKDSSWLQGLTAFLVLISTPYLSLG